MYKVIIVDDEDEIRDNLSSFVDAECPGFNVAETFEDGREAIDYLNDNDVDVVLTDIKMSDISGLELAKFVYTAKPKIKTIIISGYRDFEYAKTALEYRAIHYLLKPTKPEEIIMIFSRLYDALEIEKENENRTFQNKEMFSELLPVLREQFFYDLMTGVLQDEMEIKKRFEMLKFNFDFYNSAICAVELGINNYELLQKKWNYEKDRLKVAFINFIKEADKGIDCFYINLKADRLLLVLIIKKQENLDKGKACLENKLIRVFKHGKQLLNFNISINIMSECVRIIDTNKIFSQFYNKDKDSERQQEILFLICSLLRMANYYHSKNVMNALISTMEGYDTEYLKPMFLRFYHTLIESFEEIDFSCLTEKVKKIKLFKAFPELKDFMQNLFNDFVDIIVVSSNKNVGISSDAIILRAKSLVESNLDNSDISLEYVANKVYLNPIYFSRFFKQHTGENFVEYLISTRIQKAKELLVCDNFRIYEISAMVGYQDAKYFTRLFKKETGLTPTEYRQIQW